MDPVVTPHPTPDRWDWGCCDSIPVVDTQKGMSCRLQPSLGPAMAPLIDRKPLLVAAAGGWQLVVARGCPWQKKNKSGF